MHRTTTLRRRLILAGAAVVISSGLTTGVASAQTTAPLVDTKRSASDAFSCYYNTLLPWCRELF